VSAVRHANLTLNGSAQRLSSIFGSGQDVAIWQLWLHPDGENVGPVFVSDDGSISSSDYGVRLEAPEVGIPPAPWSPGELRTLSMYLGDVYVRGTNNDILHLWWVPVR
jgi:hypothetical protein